MIDCYSLSNLFDSLSIAAWESLASRHVTESWDWSLATGAVIVITVGYIDVGDGCWRRNAPTSKRYQQYRNSVTNARKLLKVTNLKSTTSSCHQHLCSLFCEFNLIPVAIFPSMLIFSGLIFNFCWILTQNFWAFEISKLKIPNIN